MNHITYHGHVKNREQLEFILGDQLPKKAKVWFAWSFRQQSGPKESTYNVLAYWSHEKRFYGAAAARTSFADTFTKWKISAFMFNPNASDERMHLRKELDRQTENRMRSPHPDKITAIETALMRMVAQEGAWLSGKEAPDEDVVESKPLPADGLPVIMQN